MILLCKTACPKYLLVQIYCKSSPSQFPLIQCIMSLCNLRRSILAAKMRPLMLFKILDTDMLSAVWAVGGKKRLPVSYSIIPLSSSVHCPCACDVCLFCSLSKEARRSMVSRSARGSAQASTKSFRSSYPITRVVSLSHVSFHVLTRFFSYINCSTVYCTVQIFRINHYYAILIVIACIVNNIRISYRVNNIAMLNMSRHPSHCASVSCADVYTVCHRL